jgi:hypothetical protein
MRLPFVAATLPTLQRFCVLRPTAAPGGLAPSRCHACESSADCPTKQLRIVSKAGPVDVPRLQAKPLLGCPDAVVAPSTGVRRATMSSASSSRMVRNDKAQ